MGRGTVSGRKAGRGEVLIRINPGIYPLDVIYSATYVFLDDFYIMLEGDPKKEVLVRIVPKEGSRDRDIEKRFHNELLSYSFYKKQVERNAGVRKAIIQRALATSELSGESGADYLEDPEGIAIPWEEKFGKGGRKGGHKG